MKKSIKDIGIMVTLSILVGAFIFWAVSTVLTTRSFFSTYNNPPLARTTNIQVNDQNWKVSFENYEMWDGKTLIEQPIYILHKCSMFKRFFPTKYEWQPLNSNILITLEPFIGKIAELVKPKGN